MTKYFELRESDGNDCWITYYGADNIEQVMDTVRDSLKPYYRRKLEEDWQDENEVILSVYVGRNDTGYYMSYSIREIESKDMLVGIHPLRMLI